jgi:hypothetical protein
MIMRSNLASGTAIGIERKARSGQVVGAVLCGSAVKKMH